MTKLTMSKVHMTTRWIHVIFMIFLVQGFLFSQEDVRIKKSEFKTGIDIGFREAWKSIGEADKYYEQGIGTYDLARDLYLFANQYNAANAELNYKIGVCYLYTDDKYKAIDYLLQAYNQDEDVSLDINLLLGNAYHLVLEFEHAANHYKAHRGGLDKDELTVYADVLTKRLAECQYGRDLSQEPVRVIIQNLGDGVNSKYDDYNPIFSYGDTILYFTSRRPIEKAKRNPIDNKYNEDIYLVKASGSGFGKAQRMEKPFSSKNNDALVGISADGNRMIIYRGHLGNGDIEVSEFNSKKQRWSKPKGVDKKLVSKEGETSASFSSDGQELFFVSSNRKLTTGGKDILVSKRNKRGNWEDPRNIGRVINTRYDEEGVFNTADGGTLYFGSQGHNSMGGFDIFRSERLENGQWSPPENLGFPINTPDDELFYITDQSGSTGYYSAIREGGMGTKDLYKVVFLGSEKELLTAMRDRLVAGPGVGKSGFLTLPELPELDTTIVITGRVLDTVGGEQPVVARLSYIDMDGSIADINVMTDKTGLYTVRLPEPTIYGVEINATGYLYFLDIVDLLGYTGEEKVVMDFFLQKIEVGTKVVLENIYFETGKAVLRPESFDALDQVSRFLENNPGMKIEISGHTDNTGSLRINQKLSRERAHSVVKYLVERGTPETMLGYKGYADSEPVAPNDTPEGREKNRRVEFKVLSN